MNFIMKLNLVVIISSINVEYNYDFKSSFNYSKYQFYYFLKKSYNIRLFAFEYLKSRLSTLKSFSNASGKCASRSRRGKN
jgi:hypothetical protein